MKNKRSSWKKIDSIKIADKPFTFSSLLKRIKRKIPLNTEEKDIKLSLDIEISEVEHDAWIKTYDKNVILNVEVKS